MARKDVHIQRDGTIVERDYTAAEEAEADAEAAGFPLRVWQREMDELTAALPDVYEHLYDAMDAPARGRVDQITRDKVTAKKAHRAARP